MGQNSSSERDPRPSRERNLSETTSSRSQTSNNSKSEEMASCIFSSHSMPCPDVPNAPNPIQKWLSMDAKSKEKHILHAKHCILTPYFLFSKEDECSGKVVSWLQQKQLIPKQSEYKLLSDQHISVADCAEEAIDMILSLTNSSCFLYNVFHLVEQTKECRFLSDALIIANNCRLIKDILDSWNSSMLLPVNKLPKDDTELILLVLLNQALSHILKVGDHTDTFERHVKDNHERCDALKLKGNSLFNAKKYTKACVCYSQAIKLRPFDAVLYGNRAQSYLSAAKYREALSDARRAICLNPSWEKGYFRYAKAYFHLGFLDRAIAINQQAQKRCNQTADLMQQAAMFTKESSSPSTQPVIKRQCRTSVEQQTSLPISVDDENEYQDLPDLMEDSEEELNRPGPSRKNTAGKARVRKMKQESEGAVCIRKVQSSCSYCSPKITSSSRVYDVCDDCNQDCWDEDESLFKHEQYSRTLLKTEKESESKVTEDEACSTSIDHHPMHIDGEEIPQACELLWTSDKDVSRKSSLCGVHSCESSSNHYHMCDDSDDNCRDCKCLDNISKKSEDSSCNDHRMSNNLDDKKCILHSLDESLSGRHDVDERSMPSCGCPSGVTLGNQHHMSDDSDEHPCENSSRRPDVVKKASEGVSSDDNANDEIESDSKGADDEDECVWGLCHCNDDDEWEDIEDDDDDDDNVYDSDSMDFPPLLDCSEPSDDEDEDEDDDDDQIFNPFYHVLQSMVPPPIPPQLVFGSEILLLALIHQFIESHSEFQSEDTPPGALPEVIESLVKKKVSKELIESCTSCCICQNDYVIDEMITCLPCNHVYHGPCITTWLKMHATCPTCRDVLPH